MFASGTGSMRGPRVKTPLLLLLLLLLLTTLTGTVLGQYEDDGADTETETLEEEAGDPEPEEGGDTEISETDPTVSDAPPVEDPSPPEEDPGTGDENGSGQTRNVTPDYTLETTEDPNFTGPTGFPEEEEGLSPIIILIPVVLVVVIIGMIVCGIFISRRWNNNTRNQELRKEDPYLDGSSSEKVPMPMFEDDVPSVLELEMEEFDQWMKKDGELTEDSKLA